MSRIGQKPVALPAGVQVELSGRDVRAKGPKGELAMTLVDEVEAKMEEGAVVVLPQAVSPTSPRVSPLLMQKLSPSTALMSAILLRRTPPVTGKYLRRFSTLTRQGFSMSTQAKASCPSASPAR